MSRLAWKDIASNFSIISAEDFLSLSLMERHQTINNRKQWMNEEEPPLLLLFISHRWETDQHPDPSQCQFNAICSFLRLIPTLIEATLAAKEKRLLLVPDITKEGVFQAQEIARRVLGFGNFDDRNWIPGTREKIVNKYNRLQGKSDQFQLWLLKNTGLWLDYTCMPQKPFSNEEEEQRFITTLKNLDTLVSSSTLLALRSNDDDYATRGWCASEFFLGSDQSFQRGLFINIDNLYKPLSGTDNNAPILNPALQGYGYDVIRQGYNDDLNSFKTLINYWITTEVPLSQAWPPDLWSNYRMLQGSSFYPKENDPNPMRLVIEAIKEIEVWLLANWIMANDIKETELLSTMVTILKDRNLHCKDEDDLVYLTCMIPRHGWVPFLKPFLDDLFQLHLEKKKETTIRARLFPVPIEIRKLFSAVSPSSAEVWQSRFQSIHNPSSEENIAVNNILNALTKHKPEYQFL